MTSKRCHGVFLAYGDVAAQPCRDDAFAQHILQVEHIIVRAVARLGAGAASSGGKNGLAGWQ